MDRRERARAAPAIEPARVTPAHLRLYISGWIEQLTGVRPFEFRNYEVV